MATLYITEFQRMADDDRSVAQMAEMPPVAQQTVAIGGTSAQSSAFNTLTRFIRVHTDSYCSIEFGADPTATAAKARMAADSTEYFGVVPGQKVAVITNT